MYWVTISVTFRDISLVISFLTVFLQIQTPRIIRLTTVKLIRMPHKMDSVSFCREVRMFKQSYSPQPVTGGFFKLAQTISITSSESTFPRYLTPLTLAAGQLKIPDTSASCCHSSSSFVRFADSYPSFCLAFTSPILVQRHPIQSFEYGHQLSKESASWSHLSTLSRNTPYWISSASISKLPIGCPELIMQYSLLPQQSTNEQAAQGCEQYEMLNVRQSQRSLIEGCNQRTSTALCRSFMFRYRVRLTLSVWFTSNLIESSTQDLWSWDSRIQPVFSLIKIEGMWTSRPFPSSAIVMWALSSTMLSDITTIFAPAFCPFRTFFTKLHSPRWASKMVLESFKGEIGLQRSLDQVEVDKVPLRVVPQCISPKLARLQVIQLLLSSGMTGEVILSRQSER